MAVIWDMITSSRHIVTTTMTRGSGRRWPRRRSHAEAACKRSHVGEVDKHHVGQHVIVAIILALSATVRKQQQQQACSSSNSARNLGTQYRESCTVPPCAATDWISCLLWPQARGQRDGREHAPMEILAGSWVGSALLCLLAENPGAWTARMKATSWIKGRRRRGRDGGYERKKT
jgi:hypothetical protein